MWMALEARLAPGAAEQASAVVTAVAAAAVAAAVAAAESEADGESFLCCCCGCCDGEAVGRNSGDGGVAGVKVDEIRGLKWRNLVTVQELNLSPQTMNSF